MSKTVQQRFDEKYTPEPNSGCWLWMGARNEKGYGSMDVNGRSERAHRVSYRLHRGSIPEGLFVLHKCDIRRCVNPDHLFLGTAADNTADMFAKGRASDRSGANNPNSKITKLQAEEIRASKLPISVLMEKIGLSYHQIYCIQVGYRWRTPEQEVSDG